MSVVGKYRTGKSYFLNKVLLDKPTKASGFEVGPTINACTKGLWVWDRLLEGRDSGGRKVAVLVIDSEGLNSTEVDSNYDNRVFMFCLLLSSLFIYNSMGTIDEIALQNINLILNLALKIRVKGGSEKASEDELVEAFPNFLWVLRDAFLSQEDLKGRKLTSKEYLESALKNQKSISTNAFNKNKIRTQIKKFFPVRDCLRFVRPVENESLLQRLDRVDDSKLRKEFRTQVKNARKHIFSRMKPKTCNGQNLGPRLVLELAKTYLTAINEHKELNIESSWKYVVRTQANKAKVHVLEMLGQLVARINRELSGQAGPVEESDEVGQWAREAVYGVSWEVWKDSIKRRLLQKFRRKCVTESGDQDFGDLEAAICEAVEDRLQRLEASIVSTVRNRVKKKVRERLDPLGLSAVEGELSADQCRIRLKQVLVDYVEENMSELALLKVQSRKGVQVGSLEEAYERWVEYESADQEAEAKAKLWEEVLAKEREFRTLQRFLQERESGLMEQIILGKEKHMKRMHDQMKLELEEETRREREARQREENRGKEDRERLREQVEELRTKLDERERRIGELEQELETWNMHTCQVGADPEEVRKLRETCREREEKLKRANEQKIHAEQKVANLEMKEELLSNRVKVLTSDKNDLKGYFEDFMMKYKLDREETKVAPDRDVERKLSEAVAQLTNRNLRMEEKVDKLKSYKTMVKHAASFECKLCYEQILDTDFLDHIKECSTGRSRIIGRSGNLSRGMSTVSVRHPRDINTSQRFERSVHNTSLHNERGGFYETREQSQSRVKRRGNSMRFESNFRNASSQKRVRNGMPGTRSIRSTRRLQEREDEMPALRSLVSKHNLQVCIKEKIVPQEIGIEIEHTRVKTPSKDSDSPFIFYEIKVYYGQQQSHLVYRKMRDFCSFCIKMEKTYRESGNDLEFLDEFKNAIDRMLKNRTQIQARKKILESFLQDLVDQVGGQSNALFFRFLGLERLKNLESKMLEHSQFARDEDTLHSLNMSQQKVLKTMSRNRKPHTGRRGYEESERVRGKMKPVSIYRTENHQFQIKTREFPERNDSQYQDNFYEDRKDPPRRSKRDSTYEGRRMRNKNPAKEMRYAGEDERYLRKLADKKDLLMQQSNLLFSQFETGQVHDEKPSPDKQSQGGAFYEESDESDSEKDFPIEPEGVYGTLLESKENFHTGNEGRHEEPFFESEGPGNMQNLNIEEYNREEQASESEPEKEEFDHTRGENFEEIKQSSRHLKDLQHLKMSTHKQSKRQIRKKKSKPRIYRKKPYAIQDKFKY